MKGVHRGKLMVARISEQKENLENLSFILKLKV